MTPPQGPGVTELPRSVTPAGLDAWAEAAHAEWLRLHLMAASPSRLERDRAFALVAKLASDAIRLIRAAAAQARQGGGPAAG